MYKLRRDKITYNLQYFMKYSLAVLSKVEMLKIKKQPNFLLSRIYVKFIFTSPLLWFFWKRTLWKRTYFHLLFTTSSNKNIFSLEIIVMELQVKLNFNCFKLLILWYALNTTSNTVNFSDIYWLADLRIVYYYSSNFKLDMLSLMNVDRIMLFRSLQEVYNLKSL